MNESEELFHIKQEELEVMEWVGNGSSGVVFKGLWKHTTQDVLVAIKQMKVRDKAEVVQICKEYKMMQTLQSENICQVFGGCLVNGGKEVWLVMEYVVGGDLHDFLRSHEGILPLDRQISFFIQATRAIASLHNAPIPILHRDIKSLNFLVHCDEKLVLADFGLSRHSCLINSATETIGSVRWAAPEVISSKKPQWSDRADIYSLGMMFYEIITKTLPYQEESNINDIMKRIKHGSLPKLPAEYPKDLATIIQQCWHSKPLKRPTAAQLLSALEYIQAHPEVLKKSPEVERRSLPTLEKRRSFLGRERASSLVRSANQYKKLDYQIVTMGKANGAFVARYISGAFVEKYDPNVEDWYRKQIEVDDAVRVLEITTTMEVEQLSLHELHKEQSIRKGEGFILTYDITCIDSYEYTFKMRSEILHKKGAEDIPILFVGYNSDCYGEREIEVEALREMPEFKKCNVKFMEASTKTGANVQGSFEEIVRLIDKWREAHPPSRRKKSSSGCIFL